MASTMFFALGLCIPFLIASLQEMDARPFSAYVSRAFVQVSGAMREQTS